ncbi:hypothetical protein TL16_g06261 [Triparma laevis f. inornata]|uniref:Uncharacterized protein n=2 Tax=Triparma laevis TaxID=1534972 RepID=A0A9W7FVC3_9STRA|nr:hypothetical protein TL16_g06261 [Triparma laevis f. inornata]GMI18608.1 hypothetical protein TrLO_g13438 [Triparma laevis f. longispina]
MGGDGGVIAVNRKYMRGTSTSLEAKTGRGAASHKVKSVVQDRLETMTTCKLTGEQLKESAVKCDPLGRFYDSSAVVEELLRLKQTKETRDWPIQGLSDLTTVNWSPTMECYLTGSSVMTGSIPCYIVSSGPQSGSCITAQAVKEMGAEIVEGDLIKVMADEEESKTIMDRLTEERHVKQQKKDKKKKKKREKEGHDSEKPAPKKIKPAPKPKPKPADATKNMSANVASMFHSSEDSKKQNANELFAQTGGRRF